MMRFDDTHYPRAMEHLDTTTRARAIDEANALLDEGYRLGRAISVGIARAQSDDEPEQNGHGPSLHVLYTERQWVIWPEDEDAASHRFNLLADALRRAHELALQNHSAVYVFSPGGELIEKLELHGDGVTSSYAVQVAPGSDDGWVVTRGGVERFYERHRTKREAVDSARDWARKNSCRLLIRYQSGEVQETHDYGSD